MLGGSWFCSAKKIQAVKERSTLAFAVGVVSVVVDEILVYRDDEAATLDRVVDDGGVLLALLTPKSFAR